MNPQRPDCAAPPPSHRDSTGEAIMPAKTAAIASRRPGVLAVHSVDHVAFAVPDLPQARQFYEAFGLDVKSVPGGLEVYAAANPEHCWMKISAGPGKRLRYISFGIFADDLPRFRARLSKSGLPTAPPEGIQSSDSLWLRDPHGVAIEIRVADKYTPNEKAISERTSTPAGVVASYSRGKAAQVRPQRLSHVALFSP